MFDNAFALLRKKLNKSRATSSDHSPTQQAKPIASNDSVDSELRASATALVAALGGKSNIRKLQAVAHTRVRAELIDRSKFDAAAVKKSGAKASMEVRAGIFHLIIGNEAEQLAQLMA